LCVFCFSGEKGYTVVNAVVQGNVVAFEPELPVNSVKVVFLVGEVYIKIVAEDVGNAVELF